MSYGKSFSKAPRVIVLLALMAALALLALACAPAEPPTTAPTVAPPVAAPEATAPAGAVVVAVEVPKTGRYVERAGLRLFIPQGFEFGGPIIPPDPRPPRYGGILVRHQNSDPPSIDPYHTSTTYMTFSMTYVYERLIQLPIGPGIDTTLDVRVPGLAESWDISDDFLTYTFRLRKGVKWHNLPPVNGRELDAEDVKFTFDLFNSAGSVNRGYFDAVDRVEATDKYTAVFHMKRVSPGILSVLSDTGRGFILPRESANINRRLTAIGTGAFMVATDWEYRVGISLRRNPDYWVTDRVWGNRLPYLDGVRQVIIADSSATTAAFRTGKIDTSSGGGLPTTVTDMRALMKSNPTTLVQERPASPYSTSGLGFRLDKAPWKDVRVRRALSLAIDYETLAQTVLQVPFFGSMYVPGAWYGQPSNTLEAITKDCGCPWYTYDPKRAKELLAEAGFPNGFTTTLEYFPYSVTQTATWELMAASWKEIGVNVQLKSEDLTVFRSNLTVGNWTDLAFIFVIPSPSSIYSAVQLFVPGNGSNPLTGWVNDEKLTAMVKEFEGSYRDEAKLKDLVRQMRVYWLDQVLNIPIAAGGGYGPSSPRLRNFQPANSYLVSADNRAHITAWIDDDWAFNK